MSQTNKTLPFDDLCLTCVDCGSSFDYPATEQDFFLKHGLAAPKRCRRCRPAKQPPSDRQFHVSPNPLRKPDPIPVAAPVKSTIDQTKELESLRAELRSMKMDMDELKLEVKEIRLYFKARRIAKLEKQQQGVLVKG